MTPTLDLLNDLAEFLEDQADADGGPDGYRPNRAMQLQTRVEAEIERLKADSLKVGTNGPEDSVGAKSSATGERGMEWRRQDVTSAMYYLVWHVGMPYVRADELLCAHPVLVDDFARSGRIEASRCFGALSRLVKVISNG